MQVKISNLKHELVGTLSAADDMVSIIQTMQLGERLVWPPSVTSVWARPTGRFAEAGRFEPKPPNEQLTFFVTGCVAPNLSLQAADHMTLQLLAAHPSFQAN